MSVTRFPRHVDFLNADVISWRAQQLRAAGFDLATADLLARDQRWDLHAILQLVERGCPPQLAMRIESPVEDSGMNP